MGLILAVCPNLKKAYADVLQPTHTWQCLLSRSDKQNIKDTIHASTGPWPELSSRKHVSAEDHLPSYPYPDIHPFSSFVLLLLITLLFYRPSFTWWSNLCNFSNDLYNFRCWLWLYLNIIFLFFSFFPWWHFLECLLCDGNSVSLGIIGEK